jgi:flagellar motility protein MotE (MotC chaperone)
MTMHAPSRTTGVLNMKKICFLYYLFVLPHLPFTAFALEQNATGTASTAPEQQYESVEERRLMESMHGGDRSPFAKERQELENKKKELKRLESEVDKKLDQLNQLRLQVEKLLAQKDAEEQKRIQELAKMYEKIAADKAATILGTVNQELAISILKTMKIKSAAKILNNMEGEKAAKLTTAFSTLSTP